MAENLGSVYAEIRLRMDRLRQDIVQVRTRLATAAKDVEKSGQDTANALQKGLQRAAQIMRNVGQTFADYATDIGRALNKAFGDSGKQAAQGVQQTTRSLEEVIASTRQMQREFSESARAVSKNMMELAINAGQFAGRTDDFIAALTKLGQQHKKITDQMLANNELAKASFVSAISTILARSNQSAKIADNLARIGNPLRTLDQVLLRSIGNRLDELAKRGNVAVAALRELGPTANMKQLRDQIMLINQGIMRMNMLALAAGIALAGMTVALVKAAKGPDPKEVARQQAEITRIYQVELRKRAQEIYNWADLFEKVQIGKFDKKTLMKNLQEQVNIMHQWMRDLQTLAKRGVDEGLIRELQRMGPEAAGQIRALTQMSDAELNKYVALWRQKHALATQQAMSELERLRIQTAQKIQELQNSLNPLGVSLEKFKQTWSEALGPFVDSWGQAAAKIVDVTTAIGKFFETLAQNYPVLSAMIGWFMYLFTALTLLLSPLAIGISRAGSMAVAFNQLWMTIGPLVKGFLTVAGTAAIISGAIVTLAGLFYKLWTNSESLRAAFQNLWNAFSFVAENIFSTIKPAWDQLKQAFLNFVATLIGAEPNMSSIWQTLGDKIATFVNWFTANALPLLVPAFQFLADVIRTAIEIAVAVLNKLTAWWQTWGPWIMAIVRTVFGFIKDTVLFYINAVKDIISGALKVITGIFKLFKAILTGDWKGAWDAIKQIVSGAIQFLWGFFKLWIVGRIASMIGSVLNRILGWILGFIGRSIGAFAGWVARKAALVGKWASDLASKAWNAMGGMLRAIISGLGNILARFGRFVLDCVKSVGSLGGRMVSIGKDIVHGLWNGIQSLAGWLKNKVLGWAKAVLPGPIADLLGIQSPSRLMMEYGRNIAQGLAIGLKRARRLVQDASEQLAALTVTTMPSPALAAQMAGAAATNLTRQTVNQNAPFVVIQSLTVRNEQDLRSIEQIMREMQREYIRSLRAKGMRV